MDNPRDEARRDELKYNAEVTDRTTPGKLDSVEDTEHNPDFPNTETDELADELTVVDRTRVPEQHNQEGMESAYGDDSGK